MARFTLELYEVHRIENGNIGLDDYPIFDEDYRDALNQKIINHFWNREIGQETISQFRFNLRRKMHEIMPLYNQHYKLGLDTVDPLSTVGLKSIIVQDTTNETTGTSNTESGSESKARAIGSEFPQTMLSGNGDYASNGQDNVAETTATGTGVENSTQSQTGSVENEQTGFSGQRAMLILAARQALVNVDMMVINELQELFMLITSNADSYSGKRYPYYGLY